MTPAVAPDLLRAPARVAERTCSLGRPMHLLASTPSTSDEAKRGAKEGAPHGATWVAEEQTSGRGRQGRTWTSPRGENLLFSVLLRVVCPPSRLPPLAIAAGLAVRDAIASAAPDVAPGVKWPNDVLVDGRKIAGILVEAITAGTRVEAVVVGVGLNVHTRDFPPEIAGRATSIALASREAPDRAELLADILCRLDHDAHVVLARGLGLLRARIDGADALRGRRVRSDGDDAAEGIASGIDDEGRLVVRRDDGVTERWSSGEVHLIV